jgi:hypothetical protein
LIITHKSIAPFSTWDIPGIAIANGYKHENTFNFNIEDYPGYMNRRGAGV